MAASSAAASIVITVNSTNTNAGSWFSINGGLLRQGYEWKNLATASNTAIEISTTVNAGNYGVTASTVGISSITLTAIQTIQKRKKASKKLKKPMKCFLTLKSVQLMTNMVMLV